MAACGHAACWEEGTCFQETAVEAGLWAPLQGLRWKQKLKFPKAMDEHLAAADSYTLCGKSDKVLHQLAGLWCGAVGVFEWVTCGGSVVRRRFVPGGVQNGIPNQGCKAPSAQRYTKHYCGLENNNPQQEPEALPKKAARGGGDRSKMNGFTHTRGRDRFLSTWEADAIDVEHLTCKKPRSSALPKKNNNTAAKPKKCKHKQWVRDLMSSKLTDAHYFNWYGWLHGADWSIGTPTPKQLLLKKKRRLRLPRYYVAWIRRRYGPRPRTSRFGHRAPRPVPRPVTVPKPVLKPKPELIPKKPQPFRAVYPAGKLVPQE